PRRRHRRKVRLPNGNRLPLRVHKIALSNTRNPARRNRVRLASNLQVSERPRRSIGQPENVSHLRHAPEIASAPTIDQHHYRHPAEPVIITARLVPLLARATVEPRRPIRLIQRSVLPLARLFSPAIHAQRTSDPASARINVRRNLARRLHRHQRMRRVISIRPHHHERPPIHERVNVRERRLRIKIVERPPLDHRISATTIRHIERLHVQAGLERIDSESRPVHRSLKRPQRRRNSEAHLRQTMSAVVVAVQPLIINPQTIPQHAEPLKSARNLKINRHSSPPYRKWNNRLSVSVSSRQPSVTASAHASCARIDVIAASIFWCSSGLSSR